MVEADLIIPVVTNLVLTKLTCPDDTVERKCRASEHSWWLIGHDVQTVVLCRGIGGCTVVASDPR